MRVLNPVSTGTHVGYGFGYWPLTDLNGPSWIILADSGYLCLTVTCHGDQVVSVDWSSTPCFSQELRIRCND